MSEVKRMVALRTRPTSQNRDMGHPDLWWLEDEATK
jgi:hypothetical protein